MDEQTVRDAVAQLQAQGAAPTVRKVHRLVGGSFRDIARYLKTLLPREDAAMVTPETARAFPRQVGEIAQAQERFREAHAHEGEIRRHYQVSLTRLRALREAATPPQDLREYEREVQEIETRLHQREHAVQQAEHALRELKERAATFAQRLPGLPQSLALAQLAAQEAQQEAARLVQAAQERVAGWAREVQKTEEELARLGGPEKHT
jgi:chromosome segregation ATPase